MRNIGQKQPRRHHHAPPLSRAKPPRERGPALPAPATQVRRQMGREQREIARRLVGAYEGGPKPGTLEHALKKIGDIYVHTRTAAHHVPGAGSAWDVGEQLAAGTDPIPVAQGLYRHTVHPIRALQQDRRAQVEAGRQFARAERLYRAGKITAAQYDEAVRADTSAGIIIGGPGGFRVAEAADLVRPRTRPEAEARLAKIDAQIEKTTKAVEKHIGHPLFGNDVAALRKEQLRRNRINGLIDLFEKTGKRRSGTAKALRSGRKPPVASETTAHAQAHLDALIEKHPDDPVLQHYSKMVAERNHLAAALERSPEEMFGGAPGEQVVYHGSPEGPVTKIDTLHHTKAWNEGIGFYVTESEAKAQSYARGRTATGSYAARERKAGAAEKGAVTPFKLKPGAKVLRMDAPADLTLWRRIAHGFGFDAKDFNYYIHRQAGKEPTNAAIRGELLTQLRDEHGSDALYALEEALQNEGIQATTHLEGVKGGQPHRVWVVKDASILHPHEPPKIDYGSVPVKRQAPTPKVEPVKAADVPNLPGIERSPEELRAVVAGSLGSARRIYAEQKKGYGVERSVRVAKGMQAYREAGGGMEGHLAFQRAQRGELPKQLFENLQKQELSQADLQTLIDHAYDHPDLRPYESQNAVRALLNAVQEGRTPATHEIELLRRAYGNDVAEALQKLPWHKLAKHYALSALNIPRSLMASLDVSAPFRQGLVAGAGHPIVFARNFPGMFRALRSEESYQGILDEIHSRPNFELYQKGGVKFTELGRDLNKREEQFQSDILDKLGELERKAHIPGPGRMVHASGRAYTGFLDKMRADLFDQMYERLQKKGHPVESDKYLRGIASYVNSATGRGSLDFGFANLESWAPFLNAAFFSPRLMASRINFLNPVWIARLPRGVRLQAARSILQLGLGAGTALYAAHKLAGATVNMDPRSADFAKLRRGNTRMDVLGGFQQYIRLAAQLYTGKIVSSTTGKTLELGHGYGDLTRPEITWRFLESKLNPPAAVVNDFFKGTTYAGAPVSVKQEIYSHLVPLVAQDARDLFHDTGSLPLVALLYGISAFGIGIQTYGPTKRKHKGRGGGGSRDPNPLLGGESGSNSLLPGGASSSNPYLP